MVSHLNCGSKGHVGTFAIFDEHGVEMPFHLGYSTAKKDGYRGFFFYGSNVCLTWDELRQRYPAYVKTHARLVAAGKEIRPSDDKALPMVVIYDHPKDLPAGFVVRVWEVFGDGRAVHREKLGESLADLEAARQLVPAGMVNIGRTDDDDPVIAEVWI